MDRERVIAMSEFEAPRRRMGRGLLRRLEELEAENARLRSEVEFLRTNPTMAKGLKGEALLVKLLSAQRARRGAAHDLESSNGNLRLEVKYSSLLNGIAGRPLKRWVWTKLFGERGAKEFDRLLLVGDADPRYSAQYADPACPYVFFDLPHDAAVTLVGGRKPGRSGFLQLTTNPLLLFAHSGR